jgi:hypothetical protein
MIAFLIEKDKAGEEARDRVIRLADQFMTYLEHRTFGLKTVEAGPALITGFEILYSAEIDSQGAAIAAVSFEQEIRFGRDLHAEDEAAIFEPREAYPTAELFTEAEWAGSGPLVPGGATVDGTATTVFTNETIPEGEDSPPETKPLFPDEQEP